MKKSNITMTFLILGAIVVFTAGCFRAGKSNTWWRARPAELIHNAAGVERVEPGHDNILAGGRRAVPDKQQVELTGDFDCDADCDDSDNRVKAGFGILRKNDWTDGAGRADSVCVDSCNAGQNIDFRQIIIPLATTAIVSLAIGYNVGRWRNDKVASDN